MYLGSIYSGATLPCSGSALRANLIRIGDEHISFMMTTEAPSSLTVNVEDVPRYTDVKSRIYRLRSLAITDSFS